MLTARSGLTAGQARLVERHRRGVVRLATALSRKRGCDASEMIVLLAHRCSRVGRASQAQIDVRAAGDVIVIPGILRDLPAWLERIAISGPVYDCAGNETAIAVIVIDRHGEMALCRVEVEMTVAKSRAIEPAY